MSLLPQIIRSPKFRYLVAGGWNTLFGYVVGVSLYYFLSPRLHLLLISFLANIISITMSFVSYKLFVFRTKGRWLKEYIKCYVVYGGMALVGMILLWMFVDFAHIHIAIAQAMVILATVVVSFLGHSKFTFR